ncbi:MAG: DUF4349 domain-containing protein [Patescibacteria group bacterium]|jgi:hypothetical protein
MNNLSLAAKIAKVLLITGLTAVALILIATFASTTQSNRDMAGGSLNAYDVSATTEFPNITIGMQPQPIMMDKSVASGSTESQLADSVVDQRVIKTGSVNMTSNDVSTTTAAISSLATTKGGFVQSSSTSEDEVGQASAYITIRVPSSAFETTMTEVKALGVHVNNESVSGEDVTEQFTDISARLVAAKAQETQYLLILESAESVGDVLAVQEHLAIVRSDIESLQGQINYLENRTSLATIGVTISEETTPTSTTENKFDPARDANSALALVIVLGQQALSILIWVVIVGAAIGIPVGIAMLIYRAATRRNTETSKRRR